MKPTRFSTVTTAFFGKPEMNMTPTAPSKDRAEIAAKVESLELLAPLLAGRLGVVVL